MIWAVRGKIQGHKGGSDEPPNRPDGGEEGVVQKFFRERMSKFQ